MAKLGQQAVFDKLQAAGAHATCEVCAHNQWAVPAVEGVAGVVMLSIQPSPSGTIMLGGESIPAFMNICTHCGNIRFHAVGVIAPESLRNG